MGWGSSNRRERLPGNWRALRRKCFEEYGDTCHVCGTPGADAVDHVVPGDDHSLENLRPIHSVPCHQQKSSREGSQARKSRGGYVRAKRAEEPHPAYRRRSDTSGGYPLPG